MNVTEFQNVIFYISSAFNNGGSPSINTLKLLYVGMFYQQVLTKVETMR
jgi:hypothetical protein